MGLLKGRGTCACRRPCPPTDPRGRCGVPACPNADRPLAMRGRPSHPAVAHGWPLPQQRPDPPTPKSIRPIRAWHRTGWRRAIAWGPPLRCCSNPRRPCPGWGRRRSAGLASRFEFWPMPACQTTGRYGQGGEQGGRSDAVVDRSMGTCGLMPWDGVIGAKHREQDSHSVSPE